MQSIARALQLFGLFIVPFALFYYFANHGAEDERKLMLGELTILGVGAASFWVGHLIQRKG